MGILGVTVGLALAALATSLAFGGSLAGIDQGTVLTWASVAALTGLVMACAAIAQSASVTIVSPQKPAVAVQRVFEALSGTTLSQAELQ